MTTEPKSSPENPLFHLGLDWDGTISCYAPELSLLARLAARVTIVTVNDEITVNLASDKLGIDIDRLAVCICPDERIEDYAAWKAETCRRHNIQLMIDDDHTVTNACWAAGVPALLIVERAETESK